MKNCRMPSQTKMQKQGIFAKVYTDWILDEIIEN